ncbi:hypothetical protein AYI69_g6139 [Smittium culicis]|uniref:Uncharacterized protein n=1 Tax=Smittium culicis TaxID=133412 RepID=A0A1R1Y147_9FUNG|nr:hypothetical protein AYI69_g6139 [Smittium culicis]
MEMIDYIMFKSVFHIYYDKYITYEGNKNEFTMISEALGAGMRNNTSRCYAEFMGMILFSENPGIPFHLIKNLETSVTATPYQTTLPTK